MEGLYMLCSKYDKIKLLADEYEPNYQCRRKQRKQG